MRKLLEHMTQRNARLLVLYLVAALFFGTLMPGAWKSSALGSLPSTWGLTALAHVALFACICALLPLARFWTMASWHVPVVGLTLALLTEGLQFFAVDRHPNLAGVVQDMVGSLLGWLAGSFLLARRAG